jgi:hypothetical protein
VNFVLPLEIGFSKRGGFWREGVSERRGGELAPGHFSYTTAIMPIETCPAIHSYSYCTI